MNSAIIREEIEDTHGRNCASPETSHPNQWDISLPIWYLSPSIDHFMFDYPPPIRALNRNKILTSSSLVRNACLSSTI